MAGTLFIISAPSGAGKTTLVTAVLQDLQPFMAIERVVTYTTKTPREGDINGMDYHFVSKERFDELLQGGYFMEHSRAYTDCYGSPISALHRLTQGISSILIIDRVGAQQVVKMASEVVLIWIEAPSIALLEGRLRVRGAESAEKRASRIRRAEEEIAEEKRAPLYHHHLINDCFEKARDELRNIILKKSEKEILKGQTEASFTNEPNRCSGRPYCQCL